jgi:hypothetical protein
MEAVAFSHVQKSALNAVDDGLLLALCDETIRSHKAWLTLEDTMDKARRRPSLATRDASDNAKRKYFALRTLVAHTTAMSVEAVIAKARVAADNFAPLDGDLTGVVANELNQGEVSEYDLLLTVVHDLLKVRGELSIGGQNERL